MPVVAGHDGANRQISIQTDEEELRLCSQFCRDGDFGPVPRRVVREGFLPEYFDAVKKLWPVGHNMELRHRSPPSDFTLRDYRRGIRGGNRPDGPPLQAQLQPRRSGGGEISKQRFYKTYLDVHRRRP